MRSVLHRLRGFEVHLGFRTELQVGVSEGEVHSGAHVEVENVEEAYAGDAFKRLSVQGKGWEQEFYNLLNRGFFQQAREKLYHWAAVAPMMRSDGSWDLARARLWKHIGWTQQALAALDNMKKLNPMAAQLPAIEVLRVTLLGEVGKHQQALELRRQVISEYPEHPAVKKLQNEAAKGGR